MNFKAADRAHVYHEFAKLLDAGFGVDKACESLIAHRAKPVVKQLAGDVKDGVEHGLTVSDALGASSVDVGAMEVRLVEAGEKAGRIADSFQDLASYYETVVTTRRQVITQLLYPALLIHAACILPAIPAAFKAGSITTFFISAAVPLAFVYAIGFVLFLGWRALTEKARTDTSADALLARIPGIGKARKSLALSRFCHVLGIFLLSGQRTSESVSAAGEASGSGMLLEAGKRLASTATSGSPIGPEMLAESAITPDVSRRLASAEEIGGLEKECAKCAALQRVEAAEGMQRAGKIFGIIVYIIAIILMVYQIISLFYAVSIAPIKEILDTM